MIVRIMGEGQYEVEETLVERLNEMDERAAEALERDDEEELDRRLDEMAELVRGGGDRLADDELSASEVVIPPSDLTLEETRKYFLEEGLVPDILR